jgi:hypothetical protein
MPILDMPFHFVKYSNPVEVVKVDLDTLKSWRSREVDESAVIPNLPFLRGGSQVIPWNGYRICIVHEVDLKKNYLDQKDATYRHRFITWDQDWNLVKIGEPFSFMGGEIEFCCGLAVWENDLLISFGFQDNCAFILRVPEAAITKVLEIDDVKPKSKWRKTDYPTLEITTAIPNGGCPNKCAFCPQDKIASAYQGERFLSYDNFVRLIDKVPEEVQITFAGFGEPFLNSHCADMIRYADGCGHQISIFTTGTGMLLYDMQQIKDIPFAGPQGGFVLHLPDTEGYFRGDYGDRYMSVMRAIKEAHLSNFETMTMGTLPKDLRELFPDTVRRKMFSRAGNVDRDDVIKTDTKPASTCGCCERLSHNVLLPNGDVALCCMDYGLQHILGNLFDSDYEDIVPADGAVFELCSHCENGIPA